MAASRYLDRIAISLSTICVVHCLAMPFLVAMLPVAALTVGNDGHFHALMLWLVVPTSAIGFLTLDRRHVRGTARLESDLVRVELAMRGEVGRADELRAVRDRRGESDVQRRRCVWV